MRLAINITRNGTPRVIEEDIEIALAKWIGAVEFEITEQDIYCFTADTEEHLTPDGTAAERIADIIKRDTGADVTVEFIEGWPPAAYQSPQGFTGKRMGSPSDGTGHSGSGRGGGPSGKGSI